MSEMFSYHEFDEEQIQASELIRDSAEELEATIALWCVPSREKSLALTKLEECVMWANKSFALHGVWDFEPETGCDLDCQCRGNDGPRRDGSTGDDAPGGAVSDGVYVPVYRR